MDDTLDYLTGNSAASNSQFDEAVADSDLAPVNQALYPNGEAVQALPFDLKSKLFPDSHAWGVVPTQYARNLTRTDHTRFFERQGKGWVEIYQPKSLVHSNWLCLQRISQPYAGVASGVASGEAGGASPAVSQSAQSIEKPQLESAEPVVINEPVETKTYSLALNLINPAGKPAFYATYQVNLDTGGVFTGSLDEHGQALLTSLPESQATITYAPNNALLAQYQNQVQGYLDQIIANTKVRAAEHDARLAEMSAYQRHMALTSAFIDSFWNSAENMYEVAKQAGSGLVDAASAVVQWQNEFMQSLRDGTALAELEALFVGICKQLGVAMEMAKRAWHVLKILASDSTTLAMLLNFAWEYADSLHIIDVAEFAGWVAFEAFFALLCAAAIRGSRGLAALIVIPIKAMRGINLLERIGDALETIWRILDVDSFDRLNGKADLRGQPNHEVTHHQTDNVERLEQDSDTSEVSERTLEKSADDPDDDDGTNEPGSSCNVQDVANSKCDRDPINMVTGEEVYQTVDFRLPGVIPINFVRQYRSTLTAKRTSLGYGWSHSFSEYFVPRGDGLEFVDQEFVSTHFSQARQGKTVRNQFGMTVLWQGDEVTLIHNGVVKRFYKQANNRYQLTHIETPDRSQSWRLLYREINGEQQVAQVIASWGDRLQLNYSQYGLASIVWHSASGMTKKLARYMVDAKGDLIAARDQQKRVEQYRFEQHTIVTRKWASGAIYDFEWSELGPNARCVAQRERSGTYDCRFEWDLDNNISRSIDANGVVVEFEFDDKARLIRETMPDGTEQRWHYNSLGDLLWYQNGNGERTRYTYDDQQRLTKQINALGQQTRISYLGQTFLPTRVINAAGQTTRYQYNSREQLTAIHHPDGREAHWHYDGGQLVKQVDVNGQVHKYQWHPRWGSISRYQQRTNKGDVLSELAFDYDEQGRLVSQTVVGRAGSEEKTSHYVYDEQGQLVSQVDPFGKSQKLQYDSYGRVIAHIDAAGRTTQFVYGKFAQVERLIQPDGNQIRYEYDKERNLTALINQNGQAHKFEYDVHERISREVTVDGRTTDYTYDGAGRVVALKEGELTATFERNVLGMLVREQHSAPNKQSVTIDYQYDELNRLIMADNGHAQTELSYDAAGRLAEELNRQNFNPFGQRVQPHQHSVDIHYRSDGLVSHLHHTSFRPKPKGLKYGFMHSDGRKDEWYQDYQWNSQQQLVGMLLNDEQLFSQQFNIAGQLSKRQQGAHQLEFSYDPEMRLAQTKRLGSAHELIKQRSYGYDAFGRLSQIGERATNNEKPVQRTYHYDAVDKLISVAHGDAACSSISSSASQPIKQDKAGNLLPEGLTELTNNQLPFWGDRHFTYDKHGNLKTETSGTNGCKQKQFYYSAKHQLVALLQSNKSSANAAQYSEYLYDALGRRIEKIVWQLQAPLTGTETEQQLADLARQQGEVIKHERYAWQGSTLVHVRKLVNGGLQQLIAERYIYEPGTHVPLAMHDTELGTLHFDVDHLGTPKALFDNAGALLWQAEHSVYGQAESERSFKLHPVTGEQVAPKLRFQGQYEDTESGLHYNLNRYYDAEIGRYTTQDPIGLLGGLNAYQYCPNPIEWVDPLGWVAKECDTQVGIDSKTLSSAVADRILAIKKGQRPDPATYLSAEYMQQHAAMFSGGVARVQPAAPQGKIGRTETWVMPKSVALEAIAKANGDRRLLEKLLGMDPNYLGDTPVLVDIPNPTGYRIPTGNEFAAYDNWWRPGGFTYPGGLPEAVIDPVTPDKYTTSPIQ